MADLAQAAVRMPHRALPRAPTWLELPLAVAAIFACPIAIKAGLEPSSPVVIATIAASVLSVLWLIAPAILRTYVATGSSIYPPNVLASVREAAVVGYRETDGRWTVDVRLTGMECPMSECEFQDLARSATPDRVVAAVQQIGNMIYVQHIVDGSSSRLKHRTEVFDVQGCLGA